MTQIKPIQLAAIGRVASLGELYDARSDQFLHMTIFNSPIPVPSITSTHNRQTKLKYSFNNTMEEKFNIMDISAGLKLSILSGLLDLEGSGKFFKDTKKNAKSAKASVINSISTEYESINITDNSIRKIIDSNVLTQIDATHVVVGIKWGGNVFVSVEDMNEDNKDQQTVESCLKAQLIKLADSIGAPSGNVKLEMKSENKSELSKFNFEIFGDILPDEMPQNLVEAMSFIKNATKTLQTANNGKGKTLQYSLLPISSIRNLINIKIEINTLVNQVDEAIVQQCVKLFDKILKSYQEINDHVELTQKYEKHISTSKIDKIEKIQSEFQTFKTKFQMNLSKHLIEIRSGNENMDKLQEIIDEASEQLSSCKTEYMNMFSTIEKEISFLKMMSEKGVILLDKRKTVEMFLSEHFDNEVYILFYNNEYPKGIEDPMITFRKMIDNKKTWKTRKIFAVLKNELHHLDQNSKLSLYKHMELANENFNLDLKIDVPISLTEDQTIELLDIFETRVRMSDQIEPNALGCIVELTLWAMENHQNHEQIQKNCMLIICDETIFKNMSSGYFRCFQLILDCLTKFQNEEMYEIVKEDIFFLHLYEKLSESERLNLGNNPSLIVSLIENIKKASSISTILEETIPKVSFLLIVLITLKSQNGCRIFLEKEGLDLLLTMIKKNSTVKDFTHAICKMLFLMTRFLNLRTYFMNTDILDIMRKLMKSEDIETNFLSSGTIANLCCNPYLDYDFTDCLKDLETVVLKQLSSNSSSGMNNNSFTWGLKLLNCDTYAVQLWAIWSIYGACSDKYFGKVNCRCFLKENGLDQIRRIVNSSDDKKQLREYCSKTIELLEQFV